MDQENKYYTPSLEEFHVGFEYEWSSEAISAMLRTRPTPSWQTKKVENFTDLIYLEADLTIDLIRVKYLDSQDIIDLGWSYIPDNSTGDGNFRWYAAYNGFGKWELKYYGCVEDFPELNCQLIIKFEGRHMFIGVIKNKSELSRIMKMLNII
jgi:hypothetical protein